MRFLSFSLFLISFVFLNLPCAYADIALPPGILKPYAEGKTVRTDCTRVANSLRLFLHSPGPCDYTIALREDGGKDVVAPLSGSMQHFGGQSVSMSVDIPSLKAGERVAYTFSVKGQLYRYTKVPLSEDEESGLAALGRNLRVRSGLADPDEYRYALKDKNGKSFVFDVPLVITAEKDGSYTVLWNGKIMR
ncbi:MAG: hypothetical protein J5803_01575 [Desulfovibrio sp.]|nr:hypothetical protein [Desulfovibrio sp.]